jgi:radical SAM protein with 4Fe4S-binding SPASM domain
MCTRQKLLENKCLKISEIKDELMKKIIREMLKFKRRGLGVVFTPMGLGEPLMYKNLFPLFKKISQKGIKTVLVTNGILLSEKNIGEILESGIDEVSISLNSANRDDYKKTNGVDAYDLVVGNIKKLLKTREEKRLIKPDVFVQYLGEKPESFEGEIKKWEKIMQKNDKCYVHKIVSQAGLVKAGKETENFPCSQPMFRISIKVNGDVYPCDPALYSGSNRFEQLYLGNVKQMSVFDDFFDKKSKRWQILDKMKKDDYSKLDCCKNCTTKNLTANCFFNIGKIRPHGYKWL